MHFSRSITVVGAHSAGEVGDVITGGVLDVPGDTMYAKLVHFRQHHDHIRHLLLNEPRGRSSMNTNLILPACDPRADVGFLIMESDEYAPMSGSNTICTTTVLLETGMVEMVEPVSKLVLDTVAGVVSVVAECEGGKCKSVSLDNVPAFAFVLDQEVDVPGLGKVLVDVAWGGVWYALVDASAVRLKIESRNGAKFVEIGESIKRAVQAQIIPVHPENPEIRGVTMVEFTAPLEDWQDGKTAVNTVVVSPGRLDRSPCGSGTCARLAVLYARGLLKENETLRHVSITGTEYFAHVSGTCKVGPYDGVLPTVKGSAWITSFKQIVLDPTDPFPQGFRVGDQWYVADEEPTG